MEYLNKIKRTLLRFQQIKHESKIGFVEILWDFISLRNKTQISFYEYFIFELERQPDKFRKTFLSGKN